MSEKKPFTPWTLSTDENGNPVKVPLRPSDPSPSGNDSVEDGCDEIFITEHEKYARRFADIFEGLSDVVDKVDTLNDLLEDFERCVLILRIVCSTHPQLQLSDHWPTAPLSEQLSHILGVIQDSNRSNLEARESILSDPNPDTGE